MKTESLMYMGAMIFALMVFAVTIKLLVQDINRSVKNNNQDEEDDTDEIQF